MNQRPAHLCGIVREAVRPNEIKIVLELFLGFVLLLLDFLQH
jgi:hypothetical protein